ncbi:helix-turn-helix domain-containing protein [Streptomyces meridianus]|uniref:Helix-turn-helix transcriptional regulator n=1 Tax=Streptomyces meridianus TaxID=2938945 RepID=A0ABT0X4U0_9ACTN|nr:helix-turn-helix transcriptional regulator [Streptomyces meridianus]MCM2577557.1 helix-turn-helix transcriptional regulator [Streptomyces meridianus]
MTQPKHVDPYTSPKAFYGAELRRLREAAGLSQEQLGERVFCSGTYVGQFESATRRPQPDVSRLFDEVLGCGEHFRRLCELARQSQHAEYFADAAELEKLARTISEYAPMLVPGFLQTEAYARALTRATLPLAADEDVEGHVRTRMQRAQLLTLPTAPKLWEIIHEAALRVPVGGPKVMHEQLLALAEGIRSRRFLVQVHPYSAGAHTFMTGMVSLMTFEDAPPVAYVEGAHIGQLIDESAVVERYRASYDLARAAALAPEASLTLIESVAKDYVT